jgi:hypothetical protein
MTIQTFDSVGFVSFMRSLFTAHGVHCRELVQNALEACFQAQRQHGAKDLQVRISSDLTQGVLTVADNGIGMTPNDFRDRLTTLFRSGWPKEVNDSLGIGQFGFGFYSVFLVADRVLVRSCPRGAPGETHILTIDVETNASDIVSVADGGAPGTAIEIHLRPEHRHLADADVILDDIRTTFLYTRFPLSLNGIPLNLPTPEGWSRPVAETSRAGIAEWLKERYGWDDAPLAIWPLRHSNGGWIAIPGDNDPVPGVEVYRRGVRVTAQELIPKPLNSMACAIVDVNDAQLKPDRETLADTTATAELVATLGEAVNELLHDLASQSPERFLELFRTYRQVITAALQGSEALRRQIGQQYPLQQFSRDTDTIALGELAAEKGRVLWVDDPVQQRTIADRCHRLGRSPVLLTDMTERRLVETICGDLGIPCQSVTAAFSAEMQNQAVASSAIALFRKVVPKGWDVICCEDVDARFPLTIVNIPQRSLALPQATTPLDQMIGELFRRMLTASRDKLVVLNRRNRIVADLERSSSFTAEDEHLARLLLFAGRLAGDNSVSVEEMDVFIDDLLTLFDRHAELTPFPRRS